MAKLQGFFLKHRDSVENAMSKSGDLLNEEDSAQDMEIGEWLERLNLMKYLKMFQKNQVYYVSDLRHHVDILDKTQLIGDFRFSILDDARIKIMLSPFSDEK